MYWSRELAKFTIPIFFNWLLKFIWEYYMTRWSFNNALQKHTFWTNLATRFINYYQILPKQNTDLMYQYFKLAFELSFIAWQKKKRYLAKALTEPIDLMALMIAPNASMQQSGSNWQRSDPMAYRHRQIDSTLAQWCWGSSGGGSHISGWPCHSSLHNPAKI